MLERSGQGSRDLHGFEADRVIKAETCRVQGLMPCQAVPLIEKAGAFLPVRNGHASIKVFTDNRTTARLTVQTKLMRSAGQQFKSDQ